MTVGYVNSIGRNLPVLMDVNLVPSGADAVGRPADLRRGRARVDPTFDHINVFQSIGESTYNALTATVTKRMTHGWHAQATYTLARGVDNAPLTGTYVVGSGDDRVSDPTNLERDKRRDAVQPDAHVLAVGGGRAARSPAAASARCCSTTTRSASSSRPTAACPSTSDRTSI